MHGSFFSEYSLTAIDSDINTLFGQRLSFLRKKNGMSPENFALRIDVRPLELAELEAGRAQVDLEMLNMMSNVLRLSLSELLQGL